MIDTICATLNDSELCQIVRGAIEDHFGYDEIIEPGAGVPYLYRVIHYVEACDGFARVNGFTSLMCMYCDHPFLAKAYRETGLEVLARIVEETLVLFPADHSDYDFYHYPFIDWPSFEAFIQLHPEFEATIAEFDKRYFRVDRMELEQALGRYIRIHRRVLLPLGEELQRQHEYELVRERS